MRLFHLLCLAFVSVALAQGTGADPSSPSPSPSSNSTGSAPPSGQAAPSNQTAPASPVPLCAAKCLAAGVANSYCATVPLPSNRKCTCENAELQLEVATCVARNCTVKESILFQGISKASCGVPARDEASKYYIITVVFAVMAWLLVALRIGFKYFALGTEELGWDDFFIFMTALITVPSAVITCNGTLSHGLGKDIWIVPVDDIYVFLQFFFVMTIFYFWQVGMLKMSLLFFYLRIFPAKPVQRILWGTVLFNGLVTVVYSVLDCLQCMPLSLFWTKWDGQQPGKCAIEINDLVVSNAVISIALDLWMLAVPTWQLRGLQLHWKKKLGVAAMFAVGTLFTVLSCVRLEVLIRMGKNPKNPTYDQLAISIWSTIEITIGIICACMPTFRMLLVRLFPRLGAATTHSGGRYVNSGGRYASGYAKGSRNRSQGPSKGLGGAGAPKSSPISTIGGGMAASGNSKEGSANIALKELKSASTTSSVVRPASPVNSIPTGAIRMQTEYSVTSSHFGSGGGGARPVRAEPVRDEYSDESRLVIQGNISPEPRHLGVPR